MLWVPWSAAQITAEVAFQKSEAQFLLEEGNYHSFPSPPPFSEELVCFSQYRKGQGNVIWLIGALKL